MDRVLESLDTSIELGRKYVADQERRVVRQRALIAELEHKGEQEAANNSMVLLAAMEDLLLQMQKDLAEAEQRWAERINRNETRRSFGDSRGS
jgi:hypothetical protein